MPLLLLLLAVIAPRITILVLALFTDFLSQAYNGLLIPLLGFLFLPLSTLVYAAAVVYAGGVEGPVWIASMIIAAIIDLGGVSWRVQDRRVAA